MKRVGYYSSAIRALEVSEDPKSNQLPSMTSNTYVIQYLVTKFRKFKKGFLRNA